MIDIKIDNAHVNATLERLAKAAAHPGPMMPLIAVIMHDAVMENFSQEGRPKWLGLKPATIAQKRKMGYGDKILIRRGGGQALYSSITMQSDDTSAVVGTNIKYAAIHQFGGKTRPHRIVAKNKKALLFGNGIMRRAVNHPGSAIPARPFLKLTEGDEEKIVRNVEDYLRSVVG